MATCKKEKAQFEMSRLEGGKSENGAKQFLNNNGMVSSRRKQVNRHVTAGHVGKTNKPVIERKETTLYSEW